MSDRFYFSASCEGCGEEMFEGPCLTLISHNGLPVVPLEAAAQMEFTCDHCGGSNYTGDVDLMFEGGDSDAD